MKDIYLHISDIHIQDTNDVSRDCIIKMSETLNAIGHIDNLTIIVSGDITNQGTHEQFDSAYKMLNSLKHKLKSQHELKEVSILSVPGNHDVYYGNGQIDDFGHSYFQKVLRNGVSDEVIKKELDKQSNYFNFANGLYGINKGEKLYKIVTKHIRDKRITICLINTAIFSSIDEDKGLHYLPPHLLSQIKEKLKGDINILVMHHSHHWFNDCMKNQFEKDILSNCQIIMCGHEHEMKSQKITSKDSSFIYLNGGMLSNKGEWRNSNFFLDIIDFETMELESIQYSWNETIKRYTERVNDKFQISINKEENDFKLDSDFSETLYSDPINNLTNNVFDYYVFPSIESIDEYTTKEVTVISEESDFVERVILDSKVSVVGRERYGKTLLLKRLYIALEKKGYTCLYCDFSKFKSFKLKKLVQGVFNENYETINGAYDRFNQLQKAKKVFLLDNINDIQKTGFCDLLRYLNGFFGIVVYSANEMIELDLTERVKQNIELSEYHRYKILPMRLNKRKELITNIVKIREDYEDKELVNNISSALKMQRKMYSMNPDFIIQFTEYYLKNFKDSFATEGNIFSKVFESNVVNRLNASTSKMTVDKIMILLDKIAYWCFKKQVNAFAENVIGDIVREYNEVHDDEVQILYVIQACIESKIVIEVEHGCYRFYDKNILSYFIAREIIRLWNDNLDDSDLAYLIRYIKYGVHSNVILFITYLTDNMYLIRNIIDSVYQYTEGWIAFDPVEININYLKKLNGTATIEAPQISDKKNMLEEEGKEDERVLEQYENERIEINDFFESDVHDVEDTINQIIRSMALLDVVSKCLPGFEHRMRKDDKEKVVQIMRKLPAKIFYLWAVQVDHDTDSILKYLLEDYRAVYLKPDEWDSVTKDDMLFYLQLESVSLLLELLNMPVMNGIRKHTIEYYGKNIDDNPLSCIQMMMAYSKNDSVKEFETYLNKNDERLQKPILDYMKKRVLKRFLIISEKLEKEDLQRYLSVYFPNKHPNNTYRNILIGREGYRKRK